MFFIEAVAECFPDLMNGGCSLNTVHFRGQPITVVIYHNIQLPSIEKSFLYDGEAHEGKRAKSILSILSKL